MNTITEKIYEGKQKFSETEVWPFAGPQAGVGPRGIVKM